MAEWGIDVERDDSVVLSGPYSIKFLDTTPASNPYVYGPWHPLDQTAAGSSYFYSVDVVLRADSITAGNTFLVEWEQYAADKETVVYTRTINNSGAAEVLSAINTWQTIGNYWTANSSAYWGRVKVTKASNAFNGWIDRIDVYKNPPWGQAGRVSSNQAAPTALTWTTVDFNTGSGVAMDYDGTANTLTAHVGGIYLVEGIVNFVTPGVDNGLQVRININGGTGYRYGAMVNSRGTGYDRGASVTATVLMRPGETLSLEAYTESPAAIGFGSTTEKTRLTAVKVN